MTWTGHPGRRTVTITGTVTVNNPDNGNKVMASTLTTTAPGSNCPAGSTDPACTDSVTGAPRADHRQQRRTPARPLPGSAVGYTLTITNTGQTLHRA